MSRYLHWISKLNVADVCLCASLGELRSRSSVKPLLDYRESFATEAITELCGLRSDGSACDGSPSAGGVHDLNRRWLNAVKFVPGSRSNRLDFLQGTLSQLSKHTFKIRFGVRRKRFEGFAQIYGSMRTVDGQIIGHQSNTHRSVCGVTKARPLEKSTSLKHDDQQRNLHDQCLLGVRGTKRIPRAWPQKLGVAQRAALARCSSDRAEVAENRYPTGLSEADDSDRECQDSACVRVRTIFVLVMRLRVDVFDGAAEIGPVEYPTAKRRNLDRPEGARVTGSSLQNGKRANSLPWGRNVISRGASCLIAVQAGATIASLEDTAPPSTDDVGILQHNPEKPAAPREDSGRRTDSAEAFSIGFGNGDCRRVLNGDCETQIGPFTRFNNFREKLSRQNHPERCSGQQLFSVPDHAPYSGKAETDTQSDRVVSHRGTRIGAWLNVRVSAAETRAALFLSPTPHRNTVVFTSLSAVGVGVFSCAHSHSTAIGLKHLTIAGMGAVSYTTSCFPGLRFPLRKPATQCVRRYVHRNGGRVSHSVCSTAQVFLARKDRVVLVARCPLTSRSAVRAPVGRRGGIYKKGGCAYSDRYVYVKYFRRGEVGIS